MDLAARLLEHFAKREAIDNGPNLKVVGAAGEPSSVGPPARGITLGQP